MRTRHSRHGGHHHGGGQCSSCGCMPSHCSCHGYCDSVNPYEGPVIHDDCTEICPPTDGGDIPEETCFLRWDIDAEGFPTGSTGFLVGATRSGNSLVIGRHSNGTPIDRFMYRSGVKDLGEICTGPIDIQLDIVANNYRNYFRVAATESQLFSAPFVFYTGQTVTGRYAQIHLEVSA